MKYDYLLLSHRMSSVGDVPVGKYVVVFEVSNIETRCHAREVCSHSPGHSSSLVTNVYLYQRTRPEAMQTVTKLPGWEKVLVLGG